MSAIILYGGNSYAIDPSPDYREAPAPFQVRFNNQVNPFSILGLFVMPGESITFQEGTATSGHTFSFSASAGYVKKLGTGRWRWSAPDEKGVHSLVITRDDGATVTFNVLVMVSADKLKNGWLNGYRIGDYPKVRTIRNSVYRSPAGYIEVTPETEQTLVGPHFTLGQFLCKQPGGYPKYIVLDEALIIKLELILHELNRQGIPASTLHVMSGYRTPWYNRAISNVKYSNHQYGRAADIYVDVAPHDGYMDDLNDDGQINQADADLIYDTVDRLFGRPWYKTLIGGLAKYRKNSAHGPFVHVDTRGYRARW